MRDRRSGTACAELHDAVSRNVRQLSAEALGEAPPIGVVADTAALFQHHSVDGPERLRLGCEFIQEREDVLLAGMRDVEACEAEALCPL